MKIRPLHDYVIVRRSEAEYLCKVGIAIPVSAAEKPVQGEVIAAGSGRVLKQGTVLPLTVKPADQILGSSEKFVGNPLAE